MGVRFPAEHTGSSLFHHLLDGAKVEFPEVLGKVAGLESRSAFRARYDDTTVRFEAARAAAPERATIARSITVATERAFRAGLEDGMPLCEYMQRSVEPLPLEFGGGQPIGPVPVVRVPYRGRILVGREVLDLVDELLHRHAATQAAREAIRWVVDQADSDGYLDLAGHSFVVLGASAEIAPTAGLIEAGASVLWVDVRDPPEALRRSAGGRLAWTQGGVDLLATPAEVARTIERFSQGEPLHLGLYAYAPGHGREFRLTTAMNAIVRAVHPSCLASVACLVSPTTPAVVQPEDSDAARTRRRERPTWQALLEHAGLLGEGHHRFGDTSVARTVVAIQGATYQAAQYVGKVLAAEACAAYGSRLDGGIASPVTVSANVAPITRTRSLGHPLFRAAFRGASRFGVEIFDPDTTRSLALLMMLQDVLNPDAPGAAARTAASRAARGRALFTQQIHGGIFGLPYALGPAILTAGAIGMTERPGLLLAALRGSRAPVPG